MQPKNLILDDIRRAVAADPEFRALARNDEALQSLHWDPDFRELTQYGATPDALDTN
jgi:hypothetical protein